MRYKNIKLKKMAGTIKWTEEKVKEMVEKEGYALVTYRSCNKFKTWQHKIKHNICNYEYDTPADRFLAGHRCRKCANNNPTVWWTEERVKNVFEKEGYTLLKYNVPRKSKKNKYHKIRHDECGYEYEVSFNKFKDTGHRCLKCAGQIPISKETIEETFKKVGYTILKFTSGAKSLQHVIHDECKHIYDVSYNKFIQCKTSCPKCSKYRAITEEEMKTYFENEGYSHVKFVKGVVRHQTICHIKCGYTFPMSFYAFKHLHVRCPHCKSHRSEKMVREIFETFFPQNKFVKLRPKWLERLELDGYNEELKIAFEYNGIQHYKFVEYFHKKLENFEAQKERDERKYKLCTEQEIKLCSIPYILNFREPKQLKIYIWSWLVKNNLLPANTFLHF